MCVRACMCECACACVCVCACVRASSCVSCVSWKHKALSGQLFFLMLDVISPTGSPRKQWRVTIVTSKTEYGKVRFCFLIASQPDFAQGEFISGLAVIMTRDNCSVHNRQSKTTNIVSFSGMGKNEVNNIIMLTRFEKL